MAILVACVIVPLILLCQSSFAPFTSQVPFTDTAVFSWTAYRVEHGDTMYVDVWDHKGPVIYFIFMLGLKLGGDSIVGVWALLLVMLGVSAYLIFRVLERLTNTTSAFIGACAATMALPQAIAEAGFLEEMTLIFSATAIYATAELLLADRPTTRQRVFAGLAGLCMAGLLMSRANLVGPFAGLFLGLLIAAWKGKEWGRRIVDAGIILVSAGIGVGACLFYLSSTGALAGFKSAYWDYNLLYSHAPWKDRISALVRLMRLMANPAMGTAAMLMGMGYTLAESPTAQHTNKATPKDSNPPTLQPSNPEGPLTPNAQRLTPFWLAMSIGAALSLLMAGMSGRPYGHYAGPWAPYIGLYTGVLVFAAQQWYKKKERPKWILAVAGLILALPVLKFATLVNRHRGEIANAEPTANLLQEAKLIESKTTPEDRILVWGDSGPVHWLTKRQSVTPYFYHLPILSHGYDVASVHDLVAALKKYQPPIILDRSAWSQIAVGFKPNDWTKTDPLGGFYDRDITELRDYIKTHYRESTPIGKTDVYERQ